MSINSDYVLYPSWSVFGIVLVICLLLAATRGCESCKRAEVEKERIHFSGQYEQRIVSGYQYPIWVKIAADTMESTLDSLQQPQPVRSANADGTSGVR